MCCACTHFDWAESVEEGWVEGSSSERVSVETLGNAWFHPDGPSLSQGEQTRIHSLADFDELDVIEAGDLVAVWVSWQPFPSGVSGRLIWGPGDCSHIGLGIGHRCQSGGPNIGP